MCVLLIRQDARLAFAQIYAGGLLEGLPVLFLLALDYPSFPMIKTNSQSLWLWVTHSQ
jgi:hypothetical protein